MKIALITDQHLGARENSTIILEHQRVFYDNVFFPYLIEHDIKVVVGLGDFWEKRKNTNNYIADQAKRMFFDRLKEHNIYHYMLVGNHDAPFKHTLFPNTPDTLLAEYDNIHVISYPQTISIDGFNVAMIPWICQENYDQCYEVIKNSPAITCMGHFEISGFSMYRGVESHGGLEKSLFDRYDTVLSGHYHHRSTQDNITYLGTPYELTWQDYGDPKGFHTFDLDTRKLSFIKNPYNLFVKLEYDDKDREPIDLSEIDIKNTYVKLIVVNKTNLYKYDQFLNVLYSKDVVEIKIIEDMNNFSNGEIADDIKLEDTQNVLNSYIESVDFNGDISNLKSYIQSLYTEALNTEFT